MEMRSKKFKLKETAQSALRELQQLIAGLAAEEYLLAGIVNGKRVFLIGSGGEFLTERVQRILPDYETGVLSMFTYPELRRAYYLRSEQEKAVYLKAVEKLDKMSDNNLAVMIKSFEHPGVLEGDYVHGIISMLDWAALALCEQDRRPVKA